MRSHPHITAMFVLLAETVALFGCAAGGAPASRIDARPPGAAPAPRDVGHFRTLRGPGSVGMVIDRSAGRTKVRVDGSDETIELVPVPRTPIQGDAEGRWLKGPEGMPWLFAGATGGLWFVDADARRLPERVRVTDLAPLSRDGDAAPLGAPARVGVEKTPIEAYAGDLAAISIRARFPEYTTLDAGDLAKVGEALARVDAQAFVRVSGKARERLIWTPASGDFAHEQRASYVWPPETDEPWPRDAKGLARYGAKVWPSLGGLEVAVTLRGLRGFPPQLPAGTPGVVWEAHHTTISADVVFVTLDGGRYEMKLWDSHLAKEGPPLVRGLLRDDAWPPPLTHELIDLPVIRLLARAGAVPAADVARLDERERAYAACVRRVPTTKGALAQANASRTPAESEEADARAKKAEALAAKRCAKPGAAYEEALAAFMEARGVARRAIFAKARARARELGASK